MKKILGFVVAMVALVGFTSAEESNVKIPKIIDIPFFIPQDNEEDLDANSLRLKKLLKIRLDFPQAYKIYRNNEIDEETYFGYKQEFVKSGKLELEEFLKELENYKNTHR